MLVFDAATHAYTLDGRRLPSVSQIIAPLVDFSWVSDEVLAAAAQFGRHVHEACALHARDDLDWSALDPELVPYVKAWERFLDESGAVVIASEQPVAHDALGYAGTPDLVIELRNLIYVPDIKATASVPPTVGIQTAAYARAWQRMHGGKEPWRACLHLSPDKYRLHRRNDPADWAMFQSCLNVYKFQEKHRVRH